MLVNRTIVMVNGVHNIMLISVLYMFLFMFFLYIVLFYSVRLEVHPSSGSLSRLQGLFLSLVVSVVPDVIVAVEVRFLYMCL